MLTKYKPKPKTVLFALSILAALLILIANLGRTVLLPKSSLKIEHAVAVEDGDSGIVIIDKNYDRILFTDTEGRLVNVLHLGDNGVPLDRAELVKIKDGRVFIAGYKSYDNSWYYRSEDIVEYDMAGNFVQKLYSSEFPAGDAVSYPTISKIDVLEDGALRVKSLRGKYLTTSLVRSGVKPSVQIVEASDFLSLYLQLPQNGDALVKSNSGLWYLFRASITELVPFSEQEARRLWLNNYQLMPDEAEIVFDRGIFPRNNKLSRTLDRTTGHKQLLHINYDSRLAKYDYTDKTDTLIKELPLSDGLLLRVLSFWLAALYLALVVLWPLGKILYHLHHGTAVLLMSGGMKTILAILFVAALITGFYTKVTYDHYRQTAEKEIKTQLVQVEEIIRRCYGDVLEGIAAQGKQWYEAPKNRERVIGLQEQLQRFVHAYGKNSSYYVLISFTDTHGKDFYTLTDTTGWSTTGEPNPEAMLPDGKHPDGIVYDDTADLNDYMYSTKCFRRENGRIFAVLETGCLTTNVLARQRKEAMNNFFSLLAILVGLCLVKLCVGSFLGRLELYRQERQQSHAEAWGNLVGPISFTFGITKEVDSVLNIFVIHAILPGASLAELATAAALPTALFSAGTAICNLFFNQWFFRHFSVRRAGAIGSILVAVFFALMAVAVKWKSLPLFLAAKLFSGMTLGGIMYYLVNLCSLGVKDNKRRYVLNYEGARFREVASVMAMLGGVYVAEAFGYSFIYFIAFLASGLLALIFGLTGSSECAVSHGAVTEKLRPATTGKSFFLTRTGMQLTITLFFISIVLRSYKAYIFPLCAATAELSPILVTNIAVLAKVTTITFSDHIMRLKSRLPSKLNNILSLSSNSLLLLIFLLSPSFSWSVIVLFIISINFSEADINAYITELSLRRGFPTGEMLLHLSLITGPLYALRDFLLSAMGVFSIYTTAAVIGSAGIFMVAFYTWCSREDNYSQ